MDIEFWGPLGTRSRTAIVPELFPHHLWARIRALKSGEIKQNFGLR
jgi:hypothetical protein